MELNSDSKWNHFHIINKLGKGGTCTVYKAIDIKTGKIVALKMLLEDQSVLRFKREFRSMSRLEHPNIANVYTYGEYENQAYFTMEFIEGGDLKEHFRKAQFKRENSGRQLPANNEEFKQIISLFCKICEPLEYIHSKKIVHRDLKPANIMMDINSNIKLMDFGLIKETDIIQESLTRTGKFVGTVAYMSPEQGLGRTIDHRCDLYALGVILYEVFTCRLPFVGSSILEVFMKHIKEPPIPPRNLNPNISEELEELILRLIRKEPVGRPSSASDVKYQLLNLIGESTHKIIPEQNRPRDPGDINQKFSSDDLKPKLMLPAYIGREDFSEKLFKIIECDNNKAKHVLFIAGKSGIGKSRFLKEFSGELKLQGYNVLRGACAEVEKFPFSAFLQPLEIIAEKIKTKSDYWRDAKINLGKLVSRICPRFNDFSVIQNAPEPVSLEPMQEKLRMFNAVKSILLEWSFKHKLVLVLDDFQYGDDLSFDFVKFLCRGFSDINASPRNLWILASFQSDFLNAGSLINNLMSSVESQSSFLRLDLNPLNQQQTSSFIGSMLNIEEPGADLVKEVYLESSGNPYYIEEIIKGLYEENILIRENTKWCFSIDKTVDMKSSVSLDSITSSSLPVPSRLRGLISRRLNKLEGNAKTVLAEAAVIGINFNFEILRQVSAISEDNLLDLIDVYLKNDLIQEVLEAGKEEFKFNHNMVRVVLYKSIQTRRRQKVHLRIAEIISSLFGNDNPQYWEKLALHNDAGADRIRAIEYYQKSAEMALKQGLNQSARNYSKRMIEIIKSELKEYVASYVPAIRSAYSILGQSYEVTGQLDNALDVYRDLKELARMYELKELNASSDYLIGGVESDKGNFEAALAAFERCDRALPNDAENITRRAQTMNGIASVYINIGKFHEALALLHEACEHMRQVNNRSGLAMCYLNIGMAEYYLSNYEKSYEWLQNSIHIYHELRDLYRESKGLNNLGAIYHVKGEIEKAFQCNQQALNISRKIGDIYSVAAIQGNIALYFFEKGKLTKAHDCLKESMRISKDIGDKVGITTCLINLGNLFLEQCETEGAFQYFKESIIISQEIGDKWLNAYGIFHMANCCIRSEKYEEARKWLVECANLATQICIISLEIQANLDLLYLDALQYEKYPSNKMLMKLLSEAKANNDFDSINRVELRIAEIALSQRDIKKACCMAAYGIRTARQRGRILNQWQFFLIIGKSLFCERKYQAAFRSLTIAMNLLLKLNQNIDTIYQCKIFRSWKGRETVELLMETSYVLGFDEEVAACKRLLRN